MREGKSNHHLASVFFSVFLFYHRLVHQRGQWPGAKAVSGPRHQDRGRRGDPAARGPSDPLPRRTEDHRRGGAGLRPQIEGASQASKGGRGRRMDAFPGPGEEFPSRFTLLGLEDWRSGGFVVQLEVKTCCVHLECSRVEPCEHQSWLSTINAGSDLMAPEVCHWNQKHTQL